MCDFPAKELLAYRRSLVALVQSSQSAVKIHAIGTTITLIDKLRREHEEIDGCQCWYDALMAEQSLARAAR